MGAIATITLATLALALNAERGASLAARRAGTSLVYLKISGPRCQHPIA